MCIPTHSNVQMRHFGESSSSGILYDMKHTANPKTINDICGIFEASSLYVEKYITAWTEIPSMDGCTKELAGATGLKPNISLQLHLDWIFNSI